MSRIKIDWLMVLIVLAVGITAFDYRFNPTGWYDLALFFLPVSIGLTLLLWHRLPTVSDDVRSSSWRPFTRWQSLIVLVGVGCLIVMATAQAPDPTILQFTYSMHHAHQFTLFVLGVGLIAVGMTGMSWADIRQIMTQCRHSSSMKWLLLLMLIGIGVRMIGLASAVHYYTDETNFVSAIVRLRENPHTQIMLNIGPVANFTWVYSYFTYYYTEVFGATLATLRAVSVIIGVLTIPAVYVLARWGFGRRVGYLSALLLTFDLPHMHYSRLALNNIVDPLLAVLTIAFLWRGLQTGSRQMLAMGGVFLGLTGYFYEGGRLLYPALILAWLIVYSIIKNGQIDKRGIAVYLSTAVLVVSGFYVSLGMWGFENVAPRLLQQRVDDNFWGEFFTSADTMGQLARYIDERLNPPFLHIVQQGDATGFYYSQDLSLVLPYFLPFFLIGIGASLYHWRGIGWILPMWIVLTVLGNSLIKDNDWTARFVVVFPALVVVTALGIETVYRVTGQFINRAQRRKLSRFGIGLLVCVGVLQVAYYFAVVIPQYNVDIRLELDDQDATYRAQDLALDTEVYILAPDERYHVDVGVLQAYERHRIPVMVVAIDGFDFGQLDPSADFPYAFFVIPDDADTVRRLSQIFGDRLRLSSPSPYNVPEELQYQLYEVMPAR